MWQVSAGWPGASRWLSCVPPGAWVGYVLRDNLQGLGKWYGEVSFGASP
jgi:hypothetical protein